MQDTLTTAPAAPERLAFSRSAPVSRSSSSARILILCGDGFSAAKYYEFVRAYPDAEVWSMNAQRIPEATRHFDIHFHEQPENMRSRAFAHDAGAEVIVSPFAVPCAARSEVRFPLLDIFNRFGTALYQRTLCFMLALACHEHATGRRPIDRLCLPGHDFNSWPHFGMRDGPHLWLGVARGLYITPITAPGSSLGKRWLDLWRRMPPVDWLHDLRIDQPHLYGHPRAITAPHAAFYRWE